MISLHKRMPALRRGSLKPLLADRQLIAYGRMKGSNKCVVAVNNRGDVRQVRIPVWELGITDDDVPLTRGMLTDRDGYNVGAVEYQAQDGILTLEMPANSSVLFYTESVR